MLKTTRSFFRYSPFSIDTTGFPQAAGGGVKNICNASRKPFDRLSGCGMCHDCLLFILIRNEAYEVNQFVLVSVPDGSAAGILAASLAS